MKSSLLALAVAEECAEAAAKFANSGEAVSVAAEYASAAESE